MSTPPVAAAQEWALLSPPHATLLFDGADAVNVTPRDLNVLAPTAAAETGASATDIAFAELNTDFEAIPATSGQLSEAAFDPLLKNFWQSL